MGFLIQSKKLDNNGMMHTLTRINEIDKSLVNINNDCKLKKSTKNFILSGGKEKKVKELEDKYRTREIEINKKYDNNKKTCSSNIVNIINTCSDINQQIDLNSNRVLEIEKELKTGKNNLILELQKCNNDEIIKLDSINKKYEDIKNKISINKKIDLLESINKEKNNMILKSIEEKENENENLKEENKNTILNMKKEEEKL